MNTPTEDKGYVYPDPATRPRAMVLTILGAIGVLAVGLVLHSVVRPWLDRYFLELEALAKHDPLAVKRSLLNLMALILAVSGTLAVGLGIWAVHSGWQMRRAEQWPLPGMKVYRRTKILDSKSARRRGGASHRLGAHPGDRRTGDGLEDISLQPHIFRCAQIPQIGCHRRRLRA
jgi:hypothetical protein